MGAGPARAGLPQSRLGGYNEQQWMKRRWACPSQPSGAAFTDVTTLAAAVEGAATALGLADSCGNTGAAAGGFISWRAKSRNTQAAGCPYLTCRLSMGAKLPARPRLRYWCLAGVLQRDFKHLAVDMFLTEEEGRKVLRVDCHFGRRKALASIRTCISHVQVRTISSGRRCAAAAAATAVAALLPVAVCHSMCLAPST